MKQALMHREP